MQNCYQKKVYGLKRQRIEYFITEFAIANIKELFDKTNYAVACSLGEHCCKIIEKRVEKRNFRVHSIESLISGNSLGILLKYL